MPIRVGTWAAGHTRGPNSCSLTFMFVSLRDLGSASSIPQFGNFLGIPQVYLWKLLIPLAGTPGGW